MGETSYCSSEDVIESNEHGEDIHVRKKKRSRKDLISSTEKRGICYFSRVPPHMDPASLRQILSKYGDLQRIYLVPQDHAGQVQRKQVRGFRGKQFSEGWVEFTDKRIAKRVARMLNGEQIGGRRRSTFYYDIWNIKYLSKFKWEDLTNEIANKNRAREQKLAMEISAAKRERDFYLSKVDQSRALNSIKERVKKKQKANETTLGVEAGNELQSRVMRQFPQNRPFFEDSAKRKSLLSTDLLAGVFTRSTLPGGELQ
ncbi:pre-rRNA-processing protein ESF2 isoform X1 [Phalaenopsis equestris]|uniref:pre-rRNA-processing protein ESF2 isoform X1 n=1 Tax=Phalaenopsis equestris TaxID=78828 RepID=UPI0009E58A5A|nr:pre-rRNA-processing protein ESF2 isoform X1 [Phalaenopsis equestris]XP_020574271.1 pre-rRNA-processing protein ESF2 isoform X1 [Phalaenopsis equestris]